MGERPERKEGAAETDAHDENPSGIEVVSAPRVPPAEWAFGPVGADVLELGAGDGLVAESLRAGGVPFASYTIGEISASRLAGLRRNLTDTRFRFTDASAEHPSATLTGPFDAAIMIALIEHLINPIGAMTDLRTLLKPGGFVYLDTPNIAKWTRRIKLACGRFPATASTNEGLTTYSGEQVDLYD